MKGKSITKDAQAHAHTHTHTHAHTTLLRLCVADSRRTQSPPQGKTPGSLFVTRE